MSKKEREKNQKQGLDVHQHKAANATMAYALGGGKRYAWMSAGGAKAAPKASATAPAGGAASGTVTPGASSATPAKQEDVGLRAREVRYGDWREDKAKGIQLRDWIWALEMDGKAKRGLARAFARLKSEDV